MSNNNKYKVYRGIDEEDVEREQQQDEQAELERQQAKLNGFRELPKKDQQAAVDMVDAQTSLANKLIMMNVIKQTNRDANRDR